MLDTLTLICAGFGLLGLLFLGLSLRAFRRKKLRRGLGRGATGLFWLMAASLGVTFSVSTRGYQALTQELVAATIRLRPLGADRFEATVQRFDQEDRKFELSGDELYVDAHILKWKAFANLLGLHTDYELDRIGGRYRSLKDEQTRERTIESLAADKPVDLFELRRAHSWLSPLVDAEYGSATFINAQEGGVFELRVSTSGLLIRKLPDR